VVIPARIRQYEERHERPKDGTEAHNNGIGESLA
jgi:hypothetical protein